ncbi:putative chitinase [Helianthus anomalus]
MDNFGLLLDEWRVAVDKEVNGKCQPTLLLSAATYYKPVIPWDVVHRYPVESIDKNLDWINAMCYDYHGPWTREDPTGTLAALFEPTGTLADLFDPTGHISTSGGLQSWIGAGIGRKKLVMGLPLYGRSWRLQNPTVNGLGAPAVGAGPGGEEGYMSYAQVNQFNGQVNARAVFDEATQSYYSVAGPYWITYDTVATMTRKMAYAMGLGIGGYFFWDTSNDQGCQFSRPGTH